MQTRAFSPPGAAAQPRQPAVLSSRPFGPMQAHAGAAAGAPVAAVGAMLPGIASATVVQRKIAWDKTGKTYTTTKGRAGWRAFLKKKVVEEYNDLFDTNLKPKSRLPDTDRAHRIAYASLEQLVADYCNGAASDKEVEELTDVLYDTSSEEYTAMSDERTDLFDAIESKKKPEKVVAAANALLALLNSATQNVSPGDASENRSIQEHFDPGLMASPKKGKHTVMTPISKRIFTTWDDWNRAPQILQTPGGSTRSSHHHSEYGSVVRTLEF